MAHETLRLRAAHRALTRNEGVSAETWQLWDSILENEPWNIAFTKLQETEDAAIVQACKVGEREAVNFELGPRSRDEVSQKIRERLEPFLDENGQLPSNTVLIGGPPCQAYSIVGRSRNRGIDDYKAEKDPRHFLYLEYLHVIAEFRPAVFVMENVKGMLSSRIQERQIFQTIMRDLKRPDVVAETPDEVEYVLVSLPEVDALIEDPSPEDFIVKAEEYGVPQARHRVIILGVRRDVYDKLDQVKKLVRSEPPTVWDVISDLPPLRPQLSYRGKGYEWKDSLDFDIFDKAVRSLRKAGDKTADKVADKLVDTRLKLKERKTDPGVGADRVRKKGDRLDRTPRQMAEWYGDRASELLCNHESRAHMPTDLVRYLFASAFADVTGSSPRLMDFPKCLLPQHKNVDPENVGESIFKDRFRVQVASRYSMTVTSHIAKDGHAFIHPKPMQCRSLTVREAARLQTFPDSYVFLGNRTSQYTQVGNAVPPYLASQIASIVADILKQAELA